MWSICPLLVSTGSDLTFPLDLPLSIIRFFPVHPSVQSPCACVVPDTIHFSARVVSLRCAWGCNSMPHWVVHSLPTKGSFIEAHVLFVATIHCGALAARCSETKRRQRDAYPAACLCRRVLGGTTMLSWHSPCQKQYIGSIFVQGSVNGTQDVSTTPMPLVNTTQFKTIHREDDGRSAGAREEIAARQQQARPGNYFFLPATS